MTKFIVNNKSQKLVRFFWRIIREKRIFPREEVIWPWGVEGWGWGEGRYLPLELSARSTNGYSIIFPVTENILLLQQYICDSSEKTTGNVTTYVKINDIKELLKIPFYGKELLSLCKINHRININIRVIGENYEY